MNTSGPSFAERLVTAAFCYWRLAFVVFSLTFGAAAILTILAPNKYESKMKILVKNERMAQLVGMDAHTSALINLDNISEARVNSEIELLKSTDLLRTVALRTGVISLPEDDAASKALKKMQAALSVRSLKKSNIIEVSYEGKSRAQSLNVLETLSNLYLDSHLRLNGSPGLFDFFEKQTADYQSRLNQAEADLAKFRADNHIVSLAEEKSLVLQRVASLEKQVIDNQAAVQEQAKRRAVLDTQLSGLDPRVTKEIRTIPNQYSVERLNTLLVELRNKRTDLVSKYKADDRVVIELDHQISDTQAALNHAIAMQSTENTTDINPLYQSTRSELSRADTELAGTTELARTLKQELTARRERLEKLDQISAAHEALARKVKVLEESYMSSVQKREEARTSEAMDSRQIANVAIVQTPYGPEAPSSPNRPLILSLAFVWAALMSVLATGAAYFLGGRLRTPAELESAIGLPVLATVPFDRDPSISLGPVTPLLSAGEVL